MDYKAITQFALIGISVVIVFTFIKPTFAYISTVQDELFQYSDAVSKASEFNALLSNLLATERSFSATDMQSLDVFLPSEIDEAQVMRDIEVLVEGANVQITNIKTSGPSVISTPAVFQDETTVPELGLIHQDFELILIGNYSDVKSLLREIESNAYLLEVVLLTFSSEEEVDPNEPSFSGNASSDEYKFTATLRTFALPPLTTQ